MTGISFLFPYPSNSAWNHPGLPWTLEPPKPETQTSGILSFRRGIRTVILLNPFPSPLAGRKDH